MGDVLTPRSSQEPVNSADLEAKIRAIRPLEDGSYRLTVDYQEGCLVMHLCGLVLQPIPEAFQDHLETLILEGAGRRVILDLSQCSYVSSSVLGVLVRFFKLCHDQHGHMVVVRPPERVEKVMRALGLDTFFLFVDSFAVAVDYVHRATSAHPVIK